MRHVFIIGSRGLPAHYGGFETFVDQLVSNQKSQEICYHVACLSDDQHQTHFDYKGADCFTINPPKLGPARVIAYDVMALTYALKMVKQKQIDQPIFYFLGNTIGGLMPILARWIRAVGGCFYINPDGLEWKRTKWSKPVQTYLKLAERLMCQTADLVIADNKGIEDYVHATYPKAKTTCIAYGTSLTPSCLDEYAEPVRTFFQKHELVEKQYYLVLGRFVPENNYETIIREFMASKTQRDLVIVTNHSGTKFFDQLKQRTGFDQDERIKFVGTIYEQDLLAYCRHKAFAYIHGHEVGGTNPGLLEALAHTELNLVYGVAFNRTVADDSVLYWEKSSGNLAALIDQVDSQDDFSALGQKAKMIIKERYTWDRIVGAYEELFLHES